MSTPFQKVFGPEKTPLPIKWLMGTILAFSFLLPILYLIFHRYFNPYEYLALSFWGINYGFVWQFASYFLIQPGGLSFSALISLLFTLLILWVIGSLLYEEIGKKRFFILFFGSGIFAGICSFLTMFAYSHPPMVMGSSSTINALLFATAMLFPDLELALFFLVRITIKWVIFFLIALTVLSTLFSQQWVQFVNELSAIIFAYFFGVIILKLRSPFKFTHRFDRFLHKHTYSLYSFFQRDRPSDKIINLKDELFMDQMLDKIAKNGRDSLSASEVRRMRKISKRKNSNSH